MPRKESLLCYFGCNVEGPLHKFPNPESPERFELWRKVLSPDTQLKTLYQIFDNYRLCNRHFENNFILASGRITKNAVPTLNIGFQTTETIPLLQNDITIVCSTTNPYEINEDFHDIREQALLQNERLISSLQGVALQSSQIDTQFPVSVCSPELQQGKEEKEEKENQSCGRISSLQVLALQSPQIDTEGSIPVGSRELQQENEKENNSCCLALQDMKKKMIEAEKRIKSLEMKLKKMNKKCQSQAKKIKCTQKLMCSQSYLKKLENLPEAAKILSVMQFKANKMSRGRRYTLKEKDLALAIYKQNPNTYKFLKNLIILPSQRSLQNLLSNNDCTKPK